jgi:hypothetical protein
MRFKGEMIVEVRAYLDSALMQKLIDEKPSLERKCTRQSAPRSHGACEPTENLGICLPLIVQNVKGSVRRQVGMRWRDIFPRVAGGVPASLSNRESPLRQVLPAG